MEVFSTNFFTYMLFTDQSSPVVIIMASPTQCSSPNVVDRELEHYNQSDERHEQSDGLS